MNNFFLRRSILYLIYIINKYKSLSHMNIDVGIETYYIILVL